MKKILQIKLLTKYNEQTGKFDKYAAVRIVTGDGQVLKEFKTQSQKWLEVLSD